MFPKFLRSAMLLMMLLFALSACTTTTQTNLTPVMAEMTATSSPTFTATPVLPAHQSTVTLAPTITSAPVVTSSGDKATFLEENYPDGSILKPGESFTKTWKIKNTGTTIWNTAYALVLSTAIPGDALGSPQQVYVSQPTAPGESLSLSVPLTAPNESGTYTVYWSLQNDSGQMIEIDGGETIWTKIVVCGTGQTCLPAATGGSSITSGSVSASLTSFTPGAESSTAAFCMTYPDNSGGWLPSAGNIALLVDGQTFLAISGGSLQTTACFQFEFPVGAAMLAQAQKISVSIGSIRLSSGSGDPQAQCEAARAILTQQYQGLDFTCQFSFSGYYTDLKLPAGMSVSQADQLITDAIERAVYGPWLLTVR